jgi:hypothetical protein
VREQNIEQCAIQIGVLVNVYAGFIIVLNHAAKGVGAGSFHLRPGNEDMFKVMSTYTVSILAKTFIL